MAMKKSAQGSVFAVPMPDGTFLPGRVILDIPYCQKTRLFPPDSPLPGLGKTYLVEMYSNVLKEPANERGELLVSSAFLASDEVGQNWPIVGFAEIDPARVEFPESIVGFMHPGGGCAFQCGEIRVPLSLAHETAELIGEYATCHSCYLWPHTCLRLLGRGNEVPAGYKMATITGTDLRYSTSRRQIYRYLPFRLEQSYFEKQLPLGHDLGRLYR